VINDHLKITYEHPVLTSTKGMHAFKPVQDLVVGDKMLMFDSKTTEEIINIRKVKEQVPTFNFNTSGEHIYIANGILIHNGRQKY
jgi:hypothetical protein